MRLTKAAKVRDALSHIRVEVKFAYDDEQDGSANPNTRKVRFEWINVAIDRAEKLVTPRKPLLSSGAGKEEVGK